MKKKDSLKTGQFYYGLKNKNILKSEKTDYVSKDKKIEEGKYPNGLLPFIFNLIIFIFLTLISFFSNSAFIYKWQDYIVISSGVCFCFVIAWFIIRQNFNIPLRYNLKKMSKQLKLNRLKITEPYKNDLYAVNRIKTIEDYQKYIIERKKRSKLFFLISFWLHTFLFVTFVVVSLVT